MTSGLKLSGVTLNRGGLSICREVSLSVPEGEVTVLLGANGAGKTTLLDGIAGIIPVAEGTVELGGRRIETLPVYRRAAQGLGYIDQARSIFSRLTVEENIAVVDPSASALERAFELFPRLLGRRGARAGVLSGGEQQMLLIARALAHQPSVLLIDELSFGLAPRVVQALMGTIIELANSGIGILLVEQYAELALSVGTTAHIIRRGRIVQSAPCSELINDPSALESAYLADPNG